jgi:hypothetical protein
MLYLLPANIAEEHFMSDEWKEIVAEWCGESTFIGKNQAGGTVQMGTLDGKAGVSPMEMLLVALAGCTGMDCLDLDEETPAAQQFPGKSARQTRCRVS